MELEKKSGKKKDTKKIQEEFKDFTSGDRAEPTDPKVRLFEPVIMTSE